MVGGGLRCANPPYSPVSRLAPHGILRPPKLRELVGAKRCLSHGEKLIELRRGHRRGAHHGVRLTSVMDLVLKHMQQKPVHPLALDARAPVHGHDTLQTGSVQGFDHGDQTPIHRRLRDCECRNCCIRFRVRPGRRPERAALHGVDIEQVDDQDMVERGKQAWKEAGARGVELALRKPVAGGQQPVVRPGVVVGHGLEGKNRIHDRIRGEYASVLRLIVRRRYRIPATGASFRPWVAGAMLARRWCFDAFRKLAPGYISNADIDALQSRKTSVRTESHMRVKRIVANISGQTLKDAEQFYGKIFGLELLMDHGWIVTYGSQQTMSIQLSIATGGGSGTPVPDLSIEVDDVDEALALITEAGFVIEYGPADEPWGVRRFYVRDPFGKLINVLSHIDPSAAPS